MSTDYLVKIRSYLKEEGFPKPSKPDSDNTPLPEQDSKILAKEYDFWEGWYTFARMKATEYYILSKSTGTKSEDYAFYKFIEMLAEIYESRVKRISREYSRREQAYKDNRI